MLKGCDTKELQWKDIAGYEGLYMVSNFGDVKSLPRKGTRKTEHLVSPHRVGGYIQYELLKDHIRKGHKAHRLVANAFIPNPDNLPVVNHLDGDKNNNSVDNLEWTTASENVKHSFYTLRKGVTPVAQLSKTGELLKEWGSAKEASVALGIDAPTITNACKGNRPSAGGFVWQYLRERRSSQC